LVRATRTSATLALSIALATTACQGLIGAADGSAPGGDDPRSPIVEPRPGDPRIFGRNTALGVRRLTRFEYGRTIEDLLGIAGAEADLPEGERVEGLSNNAHVSKVGLGDLEILDRVSQKISTAALAKVKLEGCTIDAPTDACVGTFVDDLLLRAFRRPASAEEKARYVGLYAARKTEDGGKEAIRCVIEAVLMSPSFLYRGEVGREGRLDDYEVASRLSYMLWGTMPDAALFAAAKAGSLLDPAKLEVEVTRMIADPRAEAGIVHFAGEWLGFDAAQLARKGQDIVGGLPATLQKDLEGETARFVADALLGAKSSVRTLLTSTSTFANATVAGIYGVSGITGNEYRKIDLDPKTRRGILTQPLLLAAHTKESGFSVVQMGKFVRERLLCQEVQPPPPGVDTKLDESPETANLPFRERFSMHATNPACSSCHGFLDPPGYAYMAYDPIGRHRTADPAGRIFDTSGTLTQVDGASHPFADLPSMIDVLVESQEFHGCFTKIFLQHAFGRGLHESDLALFRSLRDGLIASNGSFVKFVVDLARARELVEPGPR
jgi:hypothetical protein